VTTTGEETETQQHRDQITKLREKIESAYYQVTQQAKTTETSKYV